MSSSRYIGTIGDWLIWKHSFFQFQMHLNMNRIPLTREQYTKGTSTRCLVKWCSALRKKNVIHIIIMVIIMYMVLTYSDFFSINGKQDLPVDNRNNRHLMRRPLCDIVEYPKLHFGPNRTSAYHDPKDQSVTEDDVLSSEKYSNYSDFKLLIQSLISRRLVRFGGLPINALYVGDPHYDIPHPACDGLWLEFVCIIYVENWTNDNHPYVYFHLGCVSRWKYCENSSLESQVLW